MLMRGMMSVVDDLLDDDVADDVADDTWAVVGRDAGPRRR